MQSFRMDFNEMLSTNQQVFTRAFVLYDVNPCCLTLFSATGFRCLNSGVQLATSCPVHTCSVCYVDQPIPEFL